MVTGVAMVDPVRCELHAGVILTQPRLRNAWSKFDRAHLAATTFSEASVSSVNIDKF